MLASRLIKNKILAFYVSFSPPEFPAEFLTAGLAVNTNRSPYVVILLTYEHLIKIPLTVEEGTIGGRNRSKNLDSFMTWGVHSACSLGLEEIQDVVRSSEERRN